MGSVIRRGNGLLAGALLLVASSAFVYGVVGEGREARAGTGYGQITMYNQTSVAADFYVDGAFQGRALAGGFVTAQVLAGSHNMEAVCTDGRSVLQGADLQEGDSLNWNVAEN